MITLAGLLASARAAPAMLLVVGGIATIAAAGPAHALDLDPKRPLPHILQPDYGALPGSGAGHADVGGRIVPSPGYSGETFAREPGIGKPGSDRPGSDRPGSGRHEPGTAMAPLARAPLGELFRAAEAADPYAGKGFRGPDMTAPTELRKRLAIPDFTRPLPLPASAAPGPEALPPEPRIAPVIEARPEATALVQPYASRLLRIPLSDASGSPGPAERPGWTATADAPPPSPDAGMAMMAARRNPPTGPAAAMPAPVSAPPTLVIGFPIGSAAVSGAGTRALATFAALAMAEPSAIVRLRVSAPSAMPAGVGRRLAEARARSLARALAARHVGPERLAVEIAPAEAPSDHDALLVLVESGSARPGS